MNREPRGRLKSWRARARRLLRDDQWHGTAVEEAVALYLRKKDQITVDMILNSVKPEAKDAILEAIGGIRWEDLVGWLMTNYTGEWTWGTDNGWYLVDFEAPKGHETNTIRGGPCASLASAAMDAWIKREAIRRELEKNACSGDIR